MNFVLPLLVFVLSLWPQRANAQSELTSLVNDVKTVIGNIIDFILPIASLAIMGMIIYGGIQYITNQPDAGKKTIIAAVVGILIIMLAWAMVDYLYGSGEGKLLN